MAKHHERKQIERRLAMVEGHVRSVRRMIGEDKDCPVLLVQLAAIRSALDQIGKLVLKDHIHSCVAPSGRRGKKIMRSLSSALDIYIR